jgi:hypothetical protein
MRWLGNGVFGRDSRIRKQASINDTNGDRVFLGIPEVYFSNPIRVRQDLCVRDRAPNGFLALFRFVPALGLCGSKAETG